MRSPDDPAPPVVPRLLRRREAARYLSVSPATLDALRADGRVTVVRMPATRGTGALRIPLFDRRDLDALIDSWKP